MKTFNDLDFNLKNGWSHTSTRAKRSHIEFENGYGVSVITGYGSYSSIDQPYEVAVLYKGEITYDTPITNDVVGYCTEEKVTEIMKQIQEL